MANSIDWVEYSLTGCMLCHGELVRARPAPERLPTYYLDIAIGGVISGLLSVVARMCSPQSRVTTHSFPLISFVPLKAGSKTEGVEIHSRP